MTDSNPIICVGEVLWDRMPSGLFMGGAPYNVAYHLQRLGTPAAIITAVGDDDLGDKTRTNIENAGLSLDLVQTNDLPTGLVDVELLTAGPRYVIRKPAAWDAIESTADARQRLASCAGLVFGTLAQRDPRSRRTIQEFAESTPRCVLDINLRAPYIDQDTIEMSLRVASTLKLNQDELALLTAWFQLPPKPENACARLADLYSLDTICVTMGASGAGLLHEGHWLSVSGTAVNVVDTVGSGDAFLAALLHALQNKQSPARALQFANSVGAFIATRPGATPSYNQSDLESFPQ